MTQLPADEYYAHMFDIEGLTRLNRADARVFSPIVQNAIAAVHAQRCDEACALLRSDSSDESHILRNALWVKDRLFAGIVDNHIQKSPKECALEELTAYLTLPRSIVEPRMMVEEPVRESWDAMSIDPNKPEDIIRFYTETEGYVYELMAANHIAQTLYSFGEMAGRMQKLGVTNVLDYGAGAGTLCILLNRLGYSVTYADLPGKTMDFAKWRFAQRGIHVPMITLSGDEAADIEKSPLDGIDFDCILSTEVVEHVPNPVGMLAAMGRKLKSGGVLLVSESCLYTEDFVSHLPSNRQYGGEKFELLMASLGFDHVLAEPFIPQNFFVKR